MVVAIETTETTSRATRTTNRILMVSNFLSSTGTSRGACEELAAHLKQSGMEVITTSDKANKLARLADMVGTALQKRNCYDVAQIDVYSGSAFRWAEAICRVLRMLGKPFVLSLHGGGLPDFAERRPRRVKRLLASATAVTTPSTYLLQKMAPYRSSLTLIPNSLSIDGYDFRLRDQPQPQLIWLRSIHEIYNPVQAVEVLAGVLKVHPSARLTMVGPDKGDGGRQQVERRAAELGVTDQLTLTGVVPKSEVPKHLASGDIFLNTSNVDNTPISMIEAMACGLCVVSTDVGGIPFLARHEHDALLVPPRDPEAMIAAVLRVLSDTTLAASLSQHAREKTEKFDWSITLSAWRDVFDNAISGTDSFKSFG